MGLLRGLSGTSSQRGMMMVLGALVGGGKGAETERGLHASVHRAFGRILVCMLVRFVPGNLEHHFVEALYLTATCTVSGWVLPVGARKIGSSGG